MTAVSSVSAAYMRAGVTYTSGLTVEAGSNVSSRASSRGTEQTESNVKSETRRRRGNEPGSRQSSAGPARERPDYVLSAMKADLKDPVDKIVNGEMKIGEAKIGP